MATKTKFVSPFGTAQYPHISSADTTGKFADGKFKTKLVCPLTDAGAQAYIALLDKACEAAHGSKWNTMKPPKYVPYVTDEDANTVTFIFKTQYAPGIFDSRNNPVPTSTRIGGGSVLRIMGNVVEFEKGVSAQFNQVQVRALNGPGVSAFDEVDDGYAFEGSTNDNDSDTSDEGEGASKPNAALDI